MGRILLLIILIIVNGFFSATEIAFISLNDAKMEMMAKEGNKKAKKIRKILENPSKFLSTIQIGITLAGFLTSAFAAEAFAEVLAPVLYKLIPAISLDVWNNVAIILITLILSYFSIVFGELVPKRIGMKYSEKMAFGTIGVISAISIVAAPFVKFLTASTNVISKAFGIEATEESNVTEEEIRMMVDVGEEKGTIEKNEGEMINNVFEFNDKVVSEIMVPRQDVYAVDMNLSVSEVLDQISNDEEFTYSRILIYDETIDSIKGVVHVRDILLSDRNKSIKIKNLMKDVYFVPETKDVAQLLNEFRKNRKQIAVVVDEYGGTSGIVTMEDILEEIVGDIYDEYDTVEETYEKIDENTYILSGGLPTYEVEKLLDIEIPEGDYDTISGYLIELLERIPKDGEKPEIETEDAIYKIEEVEDRRIMKIKACKVEKIDEETEENEE